MSKLLVDELVAYGETDLLCYRSQDEELAALQEKEWGPVLGWLKECYGIRLAVTQGIMPVKQDKGAIGKLREVVSSCAEDELTNLARLSRTTGSLVLALGMKENRLDGEGVITLSQLDERYQMKAWGEDEETLKKLEIQAEEIRNVKRFYQQLKQSVNP